MSFKIINEEGEARTGELKTAHGIAKTPFFMPVATKLTVKHVSPMEIEEMNAQACITNAYILSLRPGRELIKKAKGVHNLMKFNRTIFSDSGGFQLIRQSMAQGINDEGIKFKDPFSQRNLFLRPEDVMHIHRELGTDVAMCLDHMPDIKGDRAAIEESLRRTHLWAEKCRKIHDGESIYGKKQLLFGIAQGGLFKDLREKSARFIDNLNFDGNALGGLALGESKQEMYDAIGWQIPFLSKQNPRYVMGLGTPEDIFEAVSRGVDCFDSIYPTQNARHCNMFTNKGQIKLDRGQYREDFKPLDEECDCYVCKTFSRAYLHHLCRSGEWAHHRYLSYHNVYFMVKLLEKMREALKKNEFNDYKKEFLKNYVKSKEI